MMAKFTCAKSGLSCEVTGFPYNFTAQGIQLQHPIFNLDYKKLVDTELVAKWVSGNMTELDAKLYFLALLNSTELVEWRCAANPSALTVSTNMADLIAITDWIHGCRNSIRANIPRLAISPDNCTLDNIKYWLADWADAKESYELGYIQVTREQQALRKEETLERLIRTTTKDISSYASILADWADLNAAFPEHVREYRGTRMSCANYWKHLIISCSKNEATIYKLNIVDLHQLVEFLEQNIDAGTIYGHAVLSLVRKGIAVHEGYLDFQIIGDSYDAGNISTEYGNIQIKQNAAEEILAKILASEAPESEPIRSQYPNVIAYYKAKISWEQAKKLNGGK